MCEKFNKLKFFLVFLLFSGFSVAAFAQQGTVSGTIQDANGPLIGATVSVVGTSTGTSTDLDGKFSLKLDAGTYTIEASYVGFGAQTTSVTLTAGGSAVADFTLSEGILVDEVIVLGSRAPGRTNTDAPVPVDVINMEKLTVAAPQTTINELLHFAVPSFNSNTQTISDGTDHIDPASLRGLGPDQVLVLVNGKRRHSSSLVNINGTFGRGNVGTDLNAIPTSAIASIEILRDGAAAQYGSDAIAGVINLRLKENVNELKFTVNTGAHFTSENSPQRDVDGETADISANYGIPLGKAGGFINFTGHFNYKGWTNRMQTFTGQIFNGYNAVETVANNAGADLSNLSMEDVQNFAQGVSHFSSDLKSQIADAADLETLQGLLNFDATEAELGARGMIRSDFNMRVGQSRVRGGKFFANMSYPISDEMEFYAFGGLGYRDGQSGCFYRLPHQSRTYTPAFINGYLPKINSEIDDKSLAVGIRGKVRGWNVDLSHVHGENQFLFHMTDSYNTTQQNSSQSTFDSGGHGFRQNTGNLDLSKYFEVEGITGVNVAFGAEYRFENYEVIPGTQASNGNFDINLNLVNSTTPNELLVKDFFGRNRPSGAQCFAGFLNSNRVDAKRSSIAGYFDTEFDITDAFLVEAAVRVENYSDFGSTFNFKIASRYKVSDDFVIRGAVSTGFRAPSLHQIHFSRTSTIFVLENGISVAQEVGVFNNTSKAAALLGIPSLEEETSLNFSAGFTAKFPDAGLKLTVDGYLIQIDDRIVLTGQFRAGDDPELQQIFRQAQATRAAFFANAIDTESKGLDIVLSHRTLIGDKGSLTNNFAATFSKTDLDGDIQASPLLERKGLVDTYFDETSKQYLEQAVPTTKLTLSHSLDLGNWNFYLRNTFIGETEEATTISSLPEGTDFTNSAKVLTDLSVGLSIGGDLSLTIGAQNLFDIYPDKVDPAFLSSGRFIYSRRSPQFSFGGRFLFARAAFTLR